MFESIITVPGSDFLGSKAFKFDARGVMPKLKPIEPLASYKSAGRAGLLKKTADAPASINTANEELSNRIEEGLAPYALLYDIPFCYLLPGEKILPPNSLRFFYLDYNWILSFMDGALSPGRTAAIDVECDKALAYDAFAHAIANAENIRRALQGRETLESIYNANPGEDFKPEICTGFLIRSPLVTGWRGLEFNAYGEKSEPLRALRIETLAEDVLLAIFQGKISSFSLGEPPEGLYYGIRGEEGNLYAGLRGFETGEQDESGQKIDIAERGRRVINFAQTARNIANGAAKKNAKETAVDSAIMALQLTRAPMTLYVHVKPEEDSKNER